MSVDLINAVSRAMCALEKAKRALEKALQAGGATGKQVELHEGDTHLQWRYVGDPEWIDLIAIADLKGDPGDQGTPGNDGKSAYELVVEDGFEGTQAQWITSLKGADGITPGLRYKFNSTLGTVPGSNKFILETTTLPFAMSLAISKFGPDGIYDNSAAIYNWAASNNQTKGSLRFTSITNPLKYLDFYVVGAITQVNDDLVIPVTNFGGDLFNNDEEVVVTFSMAGDKGNTGPSGITPGLHYKYNTAIVGAPGSNRLTLDNATIANVTTLRLSVYKPDNSAVNGGVIYSWDDSTNPVKGQLRLTDPINPSNYLEFNITGVITAGGIGEYAVIPVSYISGAAFANNANVVLTFARAGNVGNTGTNGAAGTPGDKGYRPLNAQTGTAYSLVLADQGLHITLTNAAPITVTIPTNATVAIPVGTEIDFSQLGAGQVTFTPAAGVIIRSFADNTKLAGIYSGATLKKIATNIWLLVGNLAA